MSDILLLIVKGTGGSADTQIRYTDNINGSAVTAFFLAAYSSLIASGSTHPVLLNTNKSEVIYVLIGTTVAGVLVFVTQTDVYKTCYVQFTHVHPDYRSVRLFDKMFHALEVRVKKQGCKKMTANIHVKNQGMLAILSRIGVATVFHKVEKNL